MRKEQTATNPAMDEIYKQIAYHTGKIQELLRKAKTYQRDGLFKKDGVTAEQFEAILNTGKRNGHKLFIISKYLNTNLTKTVW